MTDRLTTEQLDELETLRARVAELERALREQREAHAECCRQADALRARLKRLAEKWTVTAEQALRLAWRDARRQSAKELRALLDAAERGTT